LNKAATKLNEGKKKILSGSFSAYQLTSSVVILLTRTLVKVVATEVGVVSSVKNFFVRDKGTSDKGKEADSVKTVHRGLSSKDVLASSAINPGDIDVLYGIFNINASFAPPLCFTHPNSHCIDISNALEDREGDDYVTIYVPVCYCLVGS
jgi:hypothetical protein